MSIDSRSDGGPFGSQHVYATFIPWQADEECRKDAYDATLAAKKTGNADRYVVVDPMKDVQEDI